MAKRSSMAKRGYVSLSLGSVLFEVSFNRDYSLTDYLDEGGPSIFGFDRWVGLGKF